MLIFERWKSGLKNYDDEKCRKFYSKLISCLGTGWENKNKFLSSKISNLI